MSFNSSNLQSLPASNSARTTITTLPSSSMNTSIDHFLPTMRPAASLVGLPQEIRDEILKPLLISEDRLFLDACYRTQPEHCKWQYWAIIRTCRTLYHDIVKIFWSLNRFVSEKNKYHLS